jgi:PAS domain S-box-containing protein
MLVVGGGDGVPEAPAAFEVLSRSRAATALTYLERHHAGIDCVVVDGDVDATDLVGAVRDTYPEIAVVALVDDAHERGSRLVDAGATAVAPRHAAPAVFENRVRNAVARHRRTTVGDADREKIERLHDTAVRLERCGDEDAIYDLAVETAEAVLEFDKCYVGTVEGRDLVPQAANDDPLLEADVIMTVDEGLAGKTVREGRTYVVDDHRRDPDADPVDDGYTSALSVPVGDFALFQAVSSERAAFDDTDRELAELLMAHVAGSVERVRYETAMRRERDRFAALFQNVPDAAVHYRYEDGEPVVADVNPAFERLFGYDAHRVLGESLDDLVVPPDDAERAAAFDGAAAAGETVEAEVERLTADGRRPFLLKTAPVRTGAEPSGYTIYTDIADLKEREAELARQNDRLQEFAGIVSHDLRSPMNVAAGYLETAQAEGDVAHVDEALASLDRMDQLIEELLTLARQGRVVDETVRADVSSVATDAWSTAHPDGVDLRLDDPGSVDADRSRLRELFENLFRNVGEHAPGATTVTVGRLPDDDGFYVADDGPGLPATDDGEVFESGYTTNPDGTGFGLSIVAEIATAHGWQVAAAESETGGARFEFVTA